MIKTHAWRVRNTQLLVNFTGSSLKNRTIAGVTAMWSLSNLSFFLLPDQTLWILTARRICHFLLLIMQLPNLEPLLCVIISCRVNV